MFPIIAWNLAERSLSPSSLTTSPNLLKKEA
jgi:hypothetical protein